MLIAQAAMNLYLSWTERSAHQSSAEDGRSPCRAGRWHALGFALVLVLSFASMSSPAIAKDEYRKPALTWRLWGGDAADFDSPEEAFAAFNVAESQVYDACSAKNCGSCVKNRYTGTSKLGPYPTKINGRINSVGTDTGTTTSYSPACTIDYGGGNVVTYPPSGPTTTTNTGGIAAVAIDRCPKGWAIRINRSLGVETIDGVEVPVYEQFCGNEVPEPCKSCTRFGNPIDAVAGTKLASEADYSSADGQLQVRRTYSSIAGRWAWTHDSGLSDFTGRNSAAPQSTSLQGFVSAVPPGMYYYFNLPAPPAVPRAQSFPLVEADRDNQGKEVSVLSAEGRLVFTEATPGTFVPKDIAKPGLTAPVAGGNAQWLLMRPDRGFDLFDNVGNLVSSVKRDGKSVSYVRQSQSMTATAAPGGRVLTYSTSRVDTPAGSYDTVTLPDGSSLRYKFNPSALVTEVKFPDLQVRSLVYDEAVNTNSSDPTSWLTGIVDELGVRQATYAYDGTNPTSTELAGGVNKYTITVSPYYFYSTVSTPTSGDSSLRLSWELGPDGERRVTQRTQYAGSGSVASTTTYAYDANGNVSSKDDFNGVRSCYGYDLSRNVETGRVEGLSAGTDCSGVLVTNAVLPTGSRKVTGQWHPDWRLESKVAEPGRYTTSVYNGQPDPFNSNAIASCAPSTALLPDGKPIAVLCKQVEQATTDVDGHLGFTAALQSGVANRVQQWTYNQYGQVLTAQDPLNHTTTYAYYTDTAFTGADPHAVGHTVGDLQTVTNAKSQVTTYTQYDKHGNVLQQSDPNGVVTTNTYDLRQRLLSTSVGGQTTNYTYDPAGQLLQVTAPDASWIGYEYDVAHRMTATKDNLGNRIEYTLDNAGNRIAQNVKDPGGNLARTLARSIDALGRVQQTTGRE